MEEVLLSICVTALFAVPVVDAVAVDGSGKVTYEVKWKLIYALLRERKL